MELVKNDTDIVKKELLKGRRFPTSISEASSEEYAVPLAKGTCQRRTRETIDVCCEIHGGTTENKSPILDALWLTLIKEATPFLLGKYFTLSKNVMKKVLPKVVKESIPTFENGFDNKMRSL